MPILASRSEALDIGLPEILCRPIGVSGQVALKESLIIVMRERLVSKERNGISGGCPLSSGNLVSQSRDCACAFINFENVMSGFDRLSPWMQRDRHRRFRWLDDFDRTLSLLPQTRR